MTEKEFNNLSKDELAEATIICHNNAFNHYEGSRTIADKKLFGIANSLMILCSEELVKSLTFIFKYNEMDLPDNIKSLFTDHAPKHNIIRELYPLCLAYVELVSLDFVVKEYHFYRTNNDPIPSEVDIEKRLTEIQEKRYVKEEVKKINKWWNKANEQKNKGLYVSYKNGKWESPNDITEIDYKITNGYIDNIFFVVEMFISIIKSKVVNDKLGGKVPGLARKK
jgi:AbiV family abortive infection protein